MTAEDWLRVLTGLCWFACLIVYAIGRTWEKVNEKRSKRDRSDNS